MSTDIQYLAEKVQFKKKKIPIFLFTGIIIIGIILYIFALEAKLLLYLFNVTGDNSSGLFFYDVSFGSFGTLMIGFIAIIPVFAYFLFKGVLIKIYLLLNLYKSGFSFDLSNAELEESIDLIKSSPVDLDKVDEFFADSKERSFKVMSILEIMDQIHIRNNRIYALDRKFRYKDFEFSSQDFD